MDIVLNRQGGVAVHDQLTTQLELKILGGELQPGQRLPSIRALARRLRVHHNTVSAAYKALEASGHVLLRRGSGVYVRQGGPSTLPEATGLDEMIRVALHAAFRKGFTGAEVRTAVLRWLAATPPDRVVVVDPVREMGELLAHELEQALGLPVTAASLEVVSQEPSRIAGALVLVLPYHAEAVRRLFPAAALEVVTLEVSAEDRRAIAALPPRSIVLVVSFSPSIVPFASVLLRSLRGDDVLVEAHSLGEPRWRRVLGAADAVFADALSVAAVRKLKPRVLHEFRVVPAAAIARLREALTVVVPKSLK